MCLIDMAARSDTDQLTSGSRSHHWSFVNPSFTEPTGFADALA